MNTNNRQTNERQFNKRQTKAKKRSAQKSPRTPAATIRLEAPLGEAQRTELGSPSIKPAQPMTAAQFLHEVEKHRQSQGPLSGADPSPQTVAETMLDAGASGRRGARGARPRAHRVIKLGIDVHLDRYVVVRQIDGATPQPAQRFSPPQFLLWAKKQTDLAEQVCSCYEAGPFGYSLHRQLTAMGITNYVVRPRDWDEYGQKVKTDKRDAKELTLHLDRYLGGNQKAFCVVRVPSQAEEQARSRSRQRESLQKEKLRLAAQGRSHALYYGVPVAGEWWQEGLWQELALPPIVRELLEPLRRLIQALEHELKAATQVLVAEAPAELPVGLGDLTYEILEREICDWNRFANRRQVASYTGMCPREDTSDERRFQGAINKHGNPRVRTVLVEASWRLMRFQPEYKPVVRWQKVLADPKTTKSKRKQIAVAIGRQFSVDWWRVRTRRCKAQKLGLKLRATAPVLASSARAKVAPIARNRPLTQNGAAA